MRRAGELLPDQFNRISCSEIGVKGLSLEVILTDIFQVASAAFREANDRLQIDSLSIFDFRDSVMLAISEQSQFSQSPQLRPKDVVAHIVFGIPAGKVFQVLFLVILKYKSQNKTDIVQVLPLCLLVLLYLLKLKFQPTELEVREPIEQLRSQQSSTNQNANHQDAHISTAKFPLVGNLADYDSDHIEENGEQNPSGNNASGHESATRNAAG